MITRMWAIFVLFCSVFVAGATEPAADCQSFFQNNRYPEFLDCLHTRLYRTSVHDTAELLRLYERIGVAYAMQEKREPAIAAFNRLLAYQESYELDPTIYLPEIISLFQTVKHIRNQKSEPAKPFYEAYKPLTHILPLGLPQYVARKPVRGTVYLVWQALSLSLSVHAYQERNSLYSSTFRYPDESLALARSNDRIYKIGFISFATAYLVSVCDDLIHSKSTEEVVP